MLSLALIRVGGKRFQFFHNVETDGRELYDQDENLILIVDANLNFIEPAGRFGDLQVEGGRWVFYYGPLRTRFETGVDYDQPGRPCCWENLEKAEICAIEHYLATKLPKIKRPDETEGGACD